ncbi:putative sporulation protein YtxC [Paenibacillus arenosi]|uniref:Sporulation protein YtxC n=1 Tax=Paenibacillus arenosi TaxID=2774142 RepID=A0ABR9B3P8_9BACL|nr:putative sporulation protein YtxC [Paenibacillus arenosi]MBD8499821.1 putative sporulation protein YtxC [Paenibacillus arenosi]
MELFTIIIPRADNHEPQQLKGLLQQELGDLHTHPQGVLIEEGGQSSPVDWIACRGVLPGFQLSKQGEQVWQRAAQALAEYVLTVKEEPLVRSIISKVKQLDESEYDKIQEYCMHLLNGAEDIGGRESRQRRKAKLVRLIHAYLSEYTTLHLDGFIRFRMESYLSELREVVEYAVDEFILERQYQEFISLLKYFVFIQDTKIPLAHLVHKGGHEFELMNEKWEPLEPMHVVEGMIVEMLDGDMEMEDMIVSTLINVSPGRIVIHTRDAESQVIKTIQQIFEARVDVCEYCSSCQSFFVAGKGLTLDLAD